MRIYHLVITALNADLTEAYHQIETGGLKLIRPKLRPTLRPILHEIPFEGIMPFKESYVILDYQGQWNDRASDYYEAGVILVERDDEGNLAKAYQKPQ